MLGPFIILPLYGPSFTNDALSPNPIDKAPIILDMMAQEEIAWLNAYHQRVFDTLSPHLSPEEKDWLSTACEAIKDDKK